MRARRACAGVCIARLDVAAGSLRFEIAARTFLDRKIIQDFAQVTGFRARIGDHLLAVAVIQLLRHRKRLVRGPAPTLAAGLLQGWEIEETWRRLPLFFNRDAEWSPMPGRGLCDRLGADAFLDPHFGGRGMAHQQAATAGVGHYSRGLSGGNGANPTGSIPVHDRSRTSGAYRDFACGNHATANPIGDERKKRPPSKGRVHKGKART
jgi:hypothetical protein